MNKTVCIALMVSLLGCSDLERPNTEQFVVEGFVTAGLAVDNIKVKKTLSLEDEIMDIPIEDAIVTLFGDEGQVQLVYNEGTKKYEDQSDGFVVQVGQTVSIEIALDGTIASSSSIVPEKPTGLELSDIELEVPELTFGFLLREQIQDLFENEISPFSWKGEEGRSYYVVIEYQGEDIDPILPDGIPAESLELLSSFRCVSEPSEATSFDIIAVALESYGRHVAKVYSVNEEYIALFNSETQDSRDLNEPPSNIFNGLGIFSAFAVDSLEFDVIRP